MVQIAPSLRELGKERTTMRRILGDIEDPLGLLDDGIDVRVFEDSHDQLFSVQFDRQFYGADFESLLSNTSPMTFGSYIRESVLADWRIIGSQDTYDKSLVAKHVEGPKKEWDEFAQHHVERFIRAINASGKIFDDVKPRLITSDQAAGRLKEWVQRNTGRKRRDTFLPRMHAPYREWLKSSGLYHSKRFIRKLSPEERAQLVKRWADVPDALLRGVMESGVLGFKAAVVYDRNGEAYMVGNRKVSIEPLGNGSFRMDYGDSWITFDLTGGQAQETNRYIGSGLLPWLVWSVPKGSGERTYLSSQVPDAVASSADPRSDTILGLIAATYMSPAEKARLPKELGLPNGRYKQQMREAQIPVLVSMYRNMILGGPVFQGVERYVGVR